MGKEFMFIRSHKPNCTPSNINVHKKDLNAPEVVKIDVLEYNDPIMEEHFKILNELYANAFKYIDEVFNLNNYLK